MSGGVERREGEEATNISMSVLNIRFITYTLHGQPRLALTETRFIHRQPLEPNIDRATSQLFLGMSAGVLHLQPYTV
jgi:hypothetical protein